MSLFYTLEVNLVNFKFTLNISTRHSIVIYDFYSKPEVSKLDSDSSADIEGQIERLISSVTPKKGTALARILGVKPQAVSNAKSKGVIPKAWFIIVSEETGVSADWLLTGKKPEAESKEIGLLSNENRELRAENRELVLENRDLAKENRRLLKENGDLRENCARLEVREKRA